MIDRRRYRHSEQNEAAWMPLYCMCVCWGVIQSTMSDLLQLSPPDQSPLPVSQCNPQPVGRVGYHAHSCDITLWPGPFWLTSQGIMCAGRLRQIYVYLFVYVVLGGDLGVKLILLESVFKSWVETRCWPSSDGQAVCDHMEILSQTLCKSHEHGHTQHPTITISRFFLSISHTPTCAEYSGPEVLREVNILGPIAIPTYT